MTNTPEFFVPDIEAEKYDDHYEELAKFCSAAVPASDKRIYSITFDSHGEEWTATVGEQLRGLRQKKGKRNEYAAPERVSDSAKVLAIFKGSPFTVVTDYKLNPSVRSSWENPFLAGIPKSITYFKGEKA